MSLADSDRGPRDDGRPFEPMHAMQSWCFWAGGVLALLGTLAIAVPWAASTLVAWVIGFMLLAAGITQLGMAAGTYTWRGFWLALVCGALAVVAGTAMIAIPVEGIHVLVTFLGVMILFEAAAKLTAAFSLPRDFPWGWVLVDGLVTANSMSSSTPSTPFWMLTSTEESGAMNSRAASASAASCCTR